MALSLEADAGEKETRMKFETNDWDTMIDELTRAGPAADIEKARAEVPPGERVCVTYCAGCYFHRKTCVWPGKIIPQGHTQPGVDYYSSHRLSFLDFEKEPPDSETCRLCYEWRMYPDCQKHFGYAWWRTCSQDCSCEHHKGEVWIG